MAVMLPEALVRTEGLPDATPIGPEMFTGADQGCPKAAVAAQISFTAVPFGNAFWYQTLVRLPEASSATVPLKALVASTACVAHVPARAGVAAAKSTLSNRLVRLLHFIHLLLIASGCYFHLLAENLNSRRTNLKRASPIPIKY